MAYEWGANPDEVKLFSLNFEEQAYVLSMSNLYMLYRLGAVDTERCKKVKRKVVRETEHIHNGLVFARTMYHRYIVCTLKYYEDKKKLYELLKSGDGNEALKLALALIDTLSSEYIFGKIYERVMDSGGNVDVPETVDVAPADMEKLIIKLMDELNGDELPVCFDVLSEDDEKYIGSFLPPREALDYDIPREMIPRG